MTFNSVADAVRYIEAIASTGMNEMAECMQDIMKEQVMEQVYERYDPEVYQRTGQMEGIAQVAEIGKNYVVTEFQDNGDWTNFSGEHYFPLERFEDGTVLKAGGGYLPQTNIMEASVQKCETEIPNKFKQYLISQGLNVK